MSAPVDDEALSAFLDGELPPERRVQVARALAASPALAGRLAALAELHGDLRALFDPVLAEPVPERLRTLVEPAAPATGPGVVPFRRRAAAAWRPAALAASLALLIGLGAGWGLRAPSPPQLASLAPWASPSLQAILDTAPSGETRALGPDAEVTPVASLAAADGGWCRLFRLSGTGGPAEGVACREGDGWQVRAYVALAPVAAAPDGGYAPASGEARSPLRGLASELGLGEPIDPSREERLIGAGWQER